MCLLSLSYHSIYFVGNFGELISCIHTYVSCLNFILFICIIWILCAGEGPVQSSEVGYVGVVQVSNTGLDCAVFNFFS
jgi:hypothetical protein